MTLRAALHERALLGTAFGHRRPRIVRTQQPRPARYAHAAQMAYLRGLLGFVGVIQDALKRHVLPQLPRLVAAHAASQPRSDALERRGRRIAIVGAPRAGKTTAAAELGAALGLPAYASDDLIALGWSEASSAAADLIEAGAATGGIYEGVAVIRALRKLLERRPDKPVDDVLVLWTPHERLTAGQAAMAEGVRTIARAVLPRLAARGVSIVYSTAELGALTAQAGETAHADAADDDVEALFGQVSNDVNAQITDVQISMLAQQNALRVSEHVKGEVEAQIKSVVAIDLHAPDTGVPQHVRNFVAQQITLVRGLKAQTLAKTHSVVLEGIRQGLRAEEIAKQLREQAGLSKTRATIIANDQIGKLHGELTRLRQTSLGIKRYRWSTSRDELVRPGHRALEGSTQSWDSPPVVNAKTGKRAHPGFDTHFYPCRCSAIPIIDDLLEEAGLVTVPPPAPPANTNQPAANQNAKPRRAKPAPPPPEHTPSYWVPHYEPEYKGAAPQLAWGRAMHERGRALSLDDFRAGSQKLRKSGIEILDFDKLPYVREIAEAAKPQSIGQLLEALANDPDISNTRRDVAREIQLTSKLVAHHRALSESKQLRKIKLQKRIRLSTRNVTREQVDGARRRARTIYEAMSSKKLQHPVDYEWIADDKTRADQREPAAHRSGEINLGASKLHIAEDELTKVVLHEWGHAIEALNDSRLSGAVEFLEARAAGEVPLTMNEITNTERYKPDEVAIRDRLYDPYMGKEYKARPGNRQNIRGRFATEVTSMAVQHLRNVRTLAANVDEVDPDVIDWVLGQLANQ